MTTPAPPARSVPDAASPTVPDQVRAPGGTGRWLALALAIGVALCVGSAAALLVQALRAPAGLPLGAGLLIAAVSVLGAVQVAVLYRARESWGSTASPPPPTPGDLPVDRPEVGQQLQALLASGPSSEVGSLMREFTRILEIMQGQAAQVQDYAGRFEAINEELRNANLRLRELSLTDELTEVGNRRNFDVRMREEINRSTRFGHGFSLLLLDIDKFKKFNDEFGHPQGDAVLRALGALMRSLSREGDVPCRVGGEEFAFLLPETAKADGTAFAERMRRGVESSVNSPDGNQPITISIGLAAFPDDGKTPEDLFRAADEALYESKRAGRNRVTAYLRK